MKIDDAIEELIVREGGYTNNPNDSGGETMYGITVAVARAYHYSGPMNMLPRSTAAAIYKQRYYYEPGFDKIAVLSSRICDELIDTGVNMGPSVASKFLQRSLNVQNKQATMYPDLTADGHIGPMTVSALSTFLQDRGATQGETVMLRMLNDQQGVRYMELAEQAVKDEDFVFGWFWNRVS